MRQIGDEYRPNPHQAIGTSFIPQPDLNADQTKTLAAWMHNQRISFAYKYCTSKTINFNKGSVGDGEGKAFGACLQKFGSSFKIFGQEQSLHHQRVTDLNLD